ncbi:MAG: DUF4157 domain-containing protein [Acidobacteria bacterium]|nr:DUF4157 domain-containing protein [Acidobacteriota bacterium]
MNMQYEKDRQKPNTFQFKSQPGGKRSSGQSSPYGPAEPSPLMGHYSQTGNRAGQRPANPYGIPEPIKTHMENAFQTDFSDVTVTPNSSRAPHLGALAYTQGNEIHFAPGRYNPHTGTGQRLLGHELAHVVQQSEGRVRPTGTISGKPLNDSPQLEHEADAYGNQAASRTYGDNINYPIHSNRAQPQGSHEIMQLKSTIKTTPKKTNAETPIATLSKTFQPYYKKAVLTEVYDFHQLKNVPPSNYSQSFDIAEKAEAEIDPASRSKASGSNRNNSVIIPYGHFGVMERAIFDRPDRGGTYDGGHLVEHTLMEAQDADVHGNIAPQENKNFNQGLMRGWESIPEHYMGLQPFNYTVTVNYGEDQYKRTGKQLMDAGVLSGGFKTNLDNTNMKKLEGENVTFNRWVPSEWIGTIDAGSGKTFPQMAMTRGAHFHNIEASAAAAKSKVITTTPTTSSGAPKLMRQNSGTLAGYIETLATAGASATSLTAGGTNKITASMYQPQPLDITDQPHATTTPSGATPAIIPANTGPTNILSQTVSKNDLLTDIESYDPLGKKSRKRKSDSTIDQELKKLSPKAYKILREEKILPDAEQGVKFALELKKIITGKTTITNQDLFDAAKTATTDVRNKMILLQQDPKLTT